MAAGTMTSGFGHEEVAHEMHAALRGGDDISGLGRALLQSAGARTPRVFSPLKPQGGNLAYIFK